MTNICPICLEKLEEQNTAHVKCCRELYGSTEVPLLDLRLEDIERRAVEAINRSLSVSGVQRKLSLSCLSEKGSSRLTVVGALGGSHILKPPDARYPSMCELEHWTMQLARRAGFPAAACGLVPLASGEMAYVTRRFDRRKSQRIAMEDFCQLAEQPTQDKYRSSMEKVGALVRRWSSIPGQDALKVYGLGIFCLLTGNSDMHLKNWALLCEESKVLLAPAYDLLPTRLLIDDPEESALPIHGKKSKLRRADLLALGEHYRIPANVAVRELDRLRHLVPQSIQQLSSPWVPEPIRQRFQDIAQAMASQLA